MNKMMIILLTTLTLLLSLITGASAYDDVEEWTGNANFFIGNKQLDEDDWEPVDRQSEYGLELDFKKRSWPVSIAIDLMVSKEDANTNGVNFKSETEELNIGAKKIFYFESLNIHPFVGGGLSYIKVNATGSLFSAWGDDLSGDGIGYWMSAGFYWRVRKINIGLELKRSMADAEITINGADHNVPIGGGHTALIVGYHW